MLFQTSIPARDPRHVAVVLGEIWGGRVLPFDAAPGSYVVVADGGASSPEVHVEVHPAGADPRGDAALEGGSGGVRRGGLDTPAGAQVRLGVPRGEGELHRIARHEGWRSRTSRRDGAYGVVEIWLENWFMLEALTPEMQAEYRASVGGAGR